MKIRVFLKYFVRACGFYKKNRVYMKKFMLKDQTILKKSVFVGFLKEIMIVSENYF